MNKYNDIFSRQMDLFDGFWFANKDVRIGFSYATVNYDFEDNSINIETDCDSELGDLIYSNWNDFFSNNKNIRIVFSVDLALEDKFYSWNQIKDCIDGKLDIVLGRI